MPDHAQHPVEFLPELALGVLSETEAAPARAALEECEECREEYALLKAAVDLLPVVADEMEPPDAVRAAVLERIAAEREASDPAPIAAAKAPERGHVIRPRWAWYGAAAAGVVLLLVVGAGVLGYALSGGGDGAEREQAVVDAAARGDLLVASSVDGTTTLVRAPGESDAFIWVEDLPALPAGKTYQAWFTRDLQDFEPAETFSTAEGGEWLTADADIAAYVAMGLTIEDDGGASAPTSAPFVVVDLQKSARARDVPSFFGR